MDIERLKWDESLWPEGATHFDEDFADHDEVCWIKDDSSGTYYLLKGKWVNAELHGDRIGPVSNMIKRPGMAAIDFRWDEVKKVISDSCELRAGITMKAWQYEEIADAVIAHFDASKPWRDAYVKRLKAEALRSASMRFGGRDFEYVREALKEWAENLDKEAKID